MNAHDLVESKFMCAEDFGRNGIAKEPRVTIKDVTKEKQGGEAWGLLHFVEPWAKPLKINRTSQRALILMFGDETTAWIGKSIDLYVIRGNFPNGKQTAVRIKGSPQINRTFTFQVRRFGVGKDTYTLVPTGTKVVLGPGVVRFGRQAGHWGKPFTEFSIEQLRELVTMAEEFMAKNPEMKGKDDLAANLREIREEIDRRVQAEAPPPPEPEAEPEIDL